MRDINDYTEKYSVSGFEDYMVVLRRRKILEFIGKYKPMTILEIGCGLSPLFLDIEYELKNYCVIEPSKEFYSNALQLSKDCVFPVKIINDFFPSEKCAGESYDLIICASLLHEIENSQVFLNGIYEICTPNTIVHINVPNADSVHRLVALEMGVIKSAKELTERNQIFQQSRVYDVSSLVEELKVSQFDIIEKGTFFLKPFTHSQMFGMINQGIINKEVLEGLYMVTERGLLGEYGAEIFVNCKIRTVTK